MNEVIKVQQLAVNTKEKTILDINELTIEAGKRYVLIGPSGAGKSTLLKCIATLQPFSSGSIQVFQKYIHRKNNRLLRQKMVYVAQHEVLFQGDVSYNIGLGLKFRGFSKEKIKDKIRDVLKILGLEGYETRNVESLSGGEIQRVALGRALVLEPKLLLLDEPTANLDPYNVKLMEQAIIQYCETNGATLLMATHNMNQAKRIGQNALFIIKGKVSESGRIPSIIENPQSIELTEFLEWA